jgi:hypothetical protein
MVVVMVKAIVIIIAVVIVMASASSVNKVTDIPSEMYGVSDLVMAAFVTITSASVTIITIATVIDMAKITIVV